MLALKDTDLGENFDGIYKQVVDGETVIVSHADKRENIIIIAEKDYNELLKIKRNAEYMSEIGRRVERLEKGEGIHKTMEELRAMENE